MIKIDKEKCIGCCLCESICSEGFEIIKGKARVKNKDSNCINEAIKACPTNAILIIKEGMKGG